MKAYRSVLKSALADGYQVHIDDGEEIVKCGSSLQAAVDAIKAVEDSWILVVKPSTKNPGKWVKIAALYVIWGWDMADEETIADWHCSRDGSVKNWADRWFDAYFEDNTFAGPLDNA